MEDVRAGRVPCEEFLTQSSDVDVDVGVTATRYPFRRPPEATRGRPGQATNRRCRNSRCSSSTLVLPGKTIRTLLK